MSVQSNVEDRIGRTMVGRAAETELFQKQFDRVLEGGTGLVVISGRPGAGKTFFVEHAAGLLSGGGAAYAHGKFRQYDDRPLSAFSEIIEQAVRHILTLPTESLTHIRNDLNQRLGADAAVLLSVCPYAGILLGAHKALHTDNLEQLKYRVRNAVGRFLEIASTALFPLILFLDDLQWADPLSIQIIEVMCQDCGFLNLMLVLAWRDRDEEQEQNRNQDRPPAAGKSYLNPAKLPKDADIFIRLGGLSDGDIEQYVREIFGQEIERKEYLVRILYGLTLGNPFNISRIIRILLQENAVVWSAAARTWQLKLDRVEKLNLPTDIEQLLKKQIDGLEAEDRELLRLIACCGDTGADLLGALTGAEDAALTARFSGLCGKSLLTKTVWSGRQDGTGPGDGTGRGDGETYGFIHDIVLRLVYNSLSAEERSEIHYRVANILAEQENSEAISGGAIAAGSVTTGAGGTISAAGGAIALAAHLLKADLSLLQRDRPGKWAGALFRAGALAKQGAAVEQALEILERCAELLPCCGPEEQSRLSLGVLLELSECRYICGHAEEAKKGFESLLAEYPQTENQIRIKRKYINMCACDGDFEKVIELGLQILAHVNYKFDQKHLVVDLLKSRMLLGAGKIRRIESAPAITDERLLCILETLTAMAPSVNRMDDRMAAVIALKLAFLSARYGNSDYAPVAYATYSHVLFNFLNDHKKGGGLVETALALTERCENSAAKSAAYCILGAFSHHWSNPLAGTLDCLARSVEEGERGGASLYGSYAVTFTVFTKYAMGTPLCELKQYIADCRKKQQRLEHYLTSQIFEVYENHIRALETGAPGEEGTTPAGDGGYVRKELFADTINLSRDIIKLKRLYLEGKWPEARHLAENLDRQEVSLRGGFVMNVEFLLYSILVRLAASQDLSGEEKRRDRKLIQKHLRALKNTVSNYPDNHRARYLLAQAEYDAQFRPGKPVGGLYREAMDFAEKQGNLSLEALANLLAANSHKEDRRLSEFYAAEAARLYKKWGADHIGELIRGRLAGRRVGAGPTGEMAADRAVKTSAVRDAAGDPGDGGTAGSPAGETPLKDEAGESREAEGADNPAGDILFHLNKMEAMPEDEGYLYLLDLLVRRGHADYCAVFFEKSGEMYLKYEIRGDGGEPCVHREPVNMNHLSALPHKVLRYVARTETEILPDAGPDHSVKTGIPTWGIFAGDAYLAEKSKLSLLCLPLKYSGVLAGIIYLEKTDEEGFDGGLPSLVKGFLPMLLSKRINPVETNTPGGSPQNRNNALAGDDVLTERETEVLALIAEGMSNAEISEKLFITLGTVRNHLSSIYSKLEADNRVKAVMKAKELHIIQI
jgi:predicted ATPase/DNA-binding CsgD family transcriptional regulator